MLRCVKVFVAWNSGQQIHSCLCCSLEPSSDRFMEARLGSTASSLESLSRDSALFTTWVNMVPADLVKARIQADRRFWITPRIQFLHIFQKVRMLLAKSPETNLVPRTCHHEFLQGCMLSAPRPGCHVDPESGNLVSFAVCSIDFLDCWGRFIFQVPVA